jgi:hypothetical protein
MIENYAADMTTILRPAFHAFWQAVGREGSAHFDASGTWIGDSV